VRCETHNAIRCSCKGTAAEAAAKLKKLQARAQEEKEERVLFRQQAAAAARAAAEGRYLSWIVYWY
jgi:hypothetical protein